VVGCTVKALLEMSSSNTRTEPRVLKVEKVEKIELKGVDGAPEVDGEAEVETDDPAEAKSAVAGLLLKLKEMVTSGMLKGMNFQDQVKREEVMLLELLPLTISYVGTNDDHEQYCQ
jgi:hypothetical protein